MCVSEAMCTAQTSSKAVHILSVRTDKRETLSRFTSALLSRCKPLQISSLIFSCPLCNSSHVCPLVTALVLPSHSNISLLGSKDRSHCELSWYGNNWKWQQFLYVCLEQYDKNLQKLNWYDIVCLFPCYVEILSPKRSPILQLLSL